MSMSLHIVGFIPPDDEKFHKLKMVWDACEVAGIPIPNEVRLFFGQEGPDDNGLRVNLMQFTPEANVVVPYDGIEEDGYEINLENLSKDIKIIRVTQPW